MGPKLRVVNAGCGSALLSACIRIPSRLGSFGNKLLWGRSSLSGSWCSVRDSRQFRDRKLGGSLTTVVPHSPASAECCMDLLYAAPSVAQQPLCALWLNSLKWGESGAYFPRRKTAGGVE